MIKLTKMLFTLAVLLSVFSCGDDDEPTVSQDDLMGTWSAYSLIVEVNSSTTVAGQSTTATTNIQGLSFDYNVTFGNTDFTTEGEYELQQMSSFDGTVISNTTESYSDVMGSGTYTTENGMITINGAFFDFEFNGQSISSVSDTQTAEYEIDSSGDLIISQNETQETNANGVSSTTRIVSTSKWTRN